MPFTLQLDAPPLREEADGALRIGQSRVLLEMVIDAHQQGATPEAIVRSYPTVELADAYAVITYYLKHRDEVDRYLAERESKAEETERRLDTIQGDLSDLRAKLKAPQK